MMRFMRTNASELPYQPLIISKKYPTYSATSSSRAPSESLSYGGSSSGLMENLVLDGSR